MAIYTEILDDDDDEPGIHERTLGSAIATWAWMQDSPTPQTVASASLAFNTTPEIVRRVIEQHPWAFISGPSDDPTKQIIEHDGE